MNPTDLPPLAASLLSVEPRKLRVALARVAGAHEDAAPEWRILRDAYDGSGGFACSVRAASTGDRAGGDYDGAGLLRGRSTYLTRFSRESVAHFTARADRSAYTNHIAPIVDTYHGHLARRRAKRDSTDPATAAWLTNVDGHGHEMGEWIADVSKHAQLLGWRAALVDRMSEADAAGTVRTVVRDLDPEEIRDWQVGQDGALEWCRLGSAWSERDPATGESLEVEVYTTWTRSEWAKVRLTRATTASDSEWTVAAVTGALHDLGRVPVAVLRWQRSVRPRAFYGVSQVAAVLPLALSLFNTESEYTDHLANQNFAFLAVEGTADDLANLKLGTSEGMAYPQGYNAPQYIAPPADVAMQYALRAEQTTRAIYAAAKLERPSAEASGGDAASGVAKAYDFAATDAALQSFARSLTAFEYELVDLVARWAGDLDGRAVAATKIEWPTRYDARGIADDLGALFAMLDEKVRPLMPPRAIALAATAVVAAVFPEATDADVTTYTAEIEAMYARDVAAMGTASTDPVVAAAADVAGAIDALPVADRADPLNTATP